MNTLSVPRFQVPSGNSANSGSGVPPLNPNPKPRGQPRKLVTRGSVTVKIYGRGPFTVAWRESATGRRQRVMRSHYKTAFAFADEKATHLANQEAWRQSVGQNDWASYTRSLEILAPTKTPLELACGIFADLVKRLPPEVTPQQAIQFYLEHRPAGVVSKNIPEIVAELLHRKRADEKGEKWLRTLSHQIEKFATHFTGPLHALQPHDLNAWLRGLTHERGAHRGQPVGLRTRKNYRDGIRELVRYAQAENYLDKRWSGLKEVDNPEVPPTNIEIYTPEQLGKLLACSRSNLVPLIALMCFAGVRHEEMSAPDKKVLVTWANINLDRGYLTVDKRAAKIKKRRLIKLQPNLIAWLRPYARRSGPICDITYTGDALIRLGDRAKIPWIKNACRKSFISYRLAQTNDIALTAREAGNSPEEIEESYLELVTQEEAQRWFALRPADVMPLFDWAETRTPVIAAS